MNWGNVVVAALGFADFGVAVAYAFNRDWARVLYWLFAGGIAITTIYMGGR